MKTFLLILREPFIDKIPNIKSLIWYLMEHGNKIILVTTSSEKYPHISISHKNLSVVTIKPRNRKFELPTSLHLIFACLKYLSLNIDYIIGGDQIANIIAHYISKIFHIRHIYFMLEYPQIKTAHHPKISYLDKLDAKSLCTAHIIITHDRWHQEFIENNFHLINSQILTLPNASLTPEFKLHSTYLANTLQLNNAKIVLHSGGFGKWFKCKELANSTKNWGNDIKLVFHLSHSIKGNKYFEEIYNTDYHDRVLFSLQPVTTFELDELVASADIGIALYSVDELEYRAIYMGLASGKIGNYLKCGLPVIATRLPSLSYIEDYHCGILVESEERIADAINTILQNYDTYSLNAYTCYRELWHLDQYLDQILSAIS